MKILFVTFSGTGNTALVARELASDLGERGHECCRLAVENWDGRSFEGTCLGVGFPSYGLCSPAIIDGFLEGLPRQDRPRPSFVFSTHAWGSGNSLTVTARKLKEKNFFVIGRESFACPSNGARTFFPDSHAMYRRMVRFEPELLEKAREFARRLDEGLTLFEQEPFADLGTTSLKQSLMGLFAKHVMEGMLFRGFSVEDSCIGCGLCVKGCPDGNMEMKDGKARFLRGNDCLRCMRCIACCPVDAILFGERSRGKGRYSEAFRDELFRKTFGREVPPA